MKKWSLVILAIVLFLGAGYTWLHCSADWSVAKYNRFLKTLDPPFNEVDVHPLPGGLGYYFGYLTNDELTKLSGVVAAEFSQEEAEMLVDCAEWGRFDVWNQYSDKEIFELRKSGKMEYGNY